MENEEKVINIPKFLRKNRDGKKKDIEETNKEELNIDFDKYSDEELMRMENELDTELEQLEVQENGLKERLDKQACDRVKNEIVTYLKEREELINKCRELQSELGESGDEFEVPNPDYSPEYDYDDEYDEGLDFTPDSDEQPNAFDDDAVMEKINITDFSTLESFEKNYKDSSYEILIEELQYVIEQNNKIEGIISHLQYRINEKERESIAMEKEKNARREAIILRVNEKIEKKINLKKSIDNLNKNFKD